jgi:hypothetical protein
MISIIIRNWKKWRFHANVCERCKLLARQAYCFFDEIIGKSRHDGRGLTLWRIIKRLYGKPRLSQNSGYKGGNAVGCVLHRISLACAGMDFPIAEPGPPRLLAIDLLTEMLDRLMPHAEVDALSHSTSQEMHYTAAYSCMSSGRELKSKPTPNAA